MADAKSAEFALDCLSVAFPNQNILDDLMKQDLAITKLTIAVSGKSWSEEQKINYVKMVAKKEDLDKME